MLKILSKSFQIFLRLKRLIILVFLLYIFSFLVGYILVGVSKPEWILEYRENIIQDVFQTGPFKQIIYFLFQEKFILSIILTFGYNLIVGAFLTTTLVGVVFFIPLIVTILRGWISGVIFFGFFTTPQNTILALGTLFLEFLAYSLSAAGGIHIGLSLIKPFRYKTKSCKKALILASCDILYLYLLIMILLVLGAVWEILGIALFF